MIPECNPTPPTTNVMSSFCSGFASVPPLCQQHSERRAASDSSEMIIVAHEAPSGDEHPNACPGSATEKAQSQVNHQAPSGDEHPNACPGSATEKAQSQVTHQAPSGDEHSDPHPGSATEKAQSQVTHEAPSGDEHVNFGRKFEILASDSTCNNQSPSQPPSTTHHRRKIFSGKGNATKGKASRIPTSAGK